MTPATRLVWQAAGAPPQPGHAAGGCCLCGAHGTGVPFPQWVKAGFMNYDLLQPGTIACQACQFCALDDCAPLTQRTGKEKAQRMRNYSHVVDAADRWHPLSKGQKRALQQHLLAIPAPAVAVIATSGQKHLLFRARLGWWQVEEQMVPPFPGRLRILLALLEPLYAGGFSKREIETAGYGAPRIMAYGLPRFLAAEQALKPHRGSYALALALFLAQKPEEDDDG